MRKYKWFENVGGYLIPKKEAGAYKRRRKLAKKKAKAAMETFCDYAYSNYKGSQDGEAVTGYKDGEAVAFIHLDPEGVERILAHDNQEDLVKMLRDDL